jgi:sec-independent protein translocase protein TatA
MNPGLPELLIVLVIVLLVFGVGRVSRIGGELGSAVSNFRRGLNDGTTKDADVNKTTTTTTPSNSDV